MGTATIDHIANKQLVATLLADLSTAHVADVATVLDRHCAPDCRWEVFAPFDSLPGNRTAADEFWGPLAQAIPGWTYRPGLLIAGEFEDAAWVSTLGHVQGSLDADLVGIPPTFGMVYLRFALNAKVRDGVIQEAYVLLDMIDLMDQAGYSPFPPSLGTPEQWPAPPPGSTPGRDAYDPQLGARTMALVLEMQDGLGFGEHDQREVPLAEERNAELARYWTPTMNWYGTAGIGSMRGFWGYRRYHADPFDRALPDFSDYTDDPATNHFSNVSEFYVRFGDGRAAVTSGWPSIIGTLSGPWLGVGPAHRPMPMRVADWYRVDDSGLIVDNWVMIDLVDSLRHVGLDLFADLRFRTEPATPRWPRPTTESAATSAVTA